MFDVSLHKWKRHKMYMTFMVYFSEVRGPIIQEFLINLQYNVTLPPITIDFRLKMRLHRLALSNAALKLNGTTNDICPMFKAPWR